MTNKLSIVAGTPTKSKANDIKTRLIEEEAKYEALWLKNSSMFNPKRNALEKERITRTQKILETLLKTEDRVLDIGAGFAPLLKTYQNCKEPIAADIANNALKHLQEHKKVQKIQTALPLTSFKDQEFNIILCLDLIGLIAHKDLRLSVSELCRLLNPSGHLILSSSIDVYSIDALERLIALLETEFKLVEFTFSYHAWLIRWLQFLKAPERFFAAARNLTLRKQEIAKREKLGALWFRLNSLKITGYLWAPLAFILKPLIALFEQSKFLTSALESICHFIAHERGISHAIIVATRRPLFEKSQESPMPDRKPFRREVKWE